MPEKNNLIDNTSVLGYNLIMKRNKSLEDYLECILLLSRENEFVHRVDVAFRNPLCRKRLKFYKTKVM